MAKVTSTLLFAAAIVVLMLLNEVYGQSQRVQKEGQGNKKNKGSQNGRTDKNQRPRNKQSDQRERRMRNGYRKPMSNFFISYHDMNPRAFFNFRWNLATRREEPWWQGPNVCENEVEEISNNTAPRRDMVRHFSTTSQVCDESDSVYKCTIVQQNNDGLRRLTVVYECCHGYTRLKRDSGCPRQIIMRSLMEKAEELGLHDFIRTVKTVKLSKELERGNLTLFVPIQGFQPQESEILNMESNDVMFQDAPVAMITILERAEDKTTQNLQRIFLNHLVLGTVRTSHMEDEQLLQTASSDDTTIRINYFSRPEKMMTANCLPIVSRDNMATNGVINLVEKVIQPVSRTLLELVRTTPELSALNIVLEATNFMSMLDQPGQLTLLAPINSAFEKMNKRFKTKVFNGEKTCLEKIFENHLLPNVICSVAIQGQARTANYLRRYINLTRTVDNKLFMNGAQIIQSDIMGTNGVLHLIDNVLIPEQALGVLDLIKKKGYGEYIRLVEKAGLTKTLETTMNMKVFVPSDEALRNLPLEVKKKLNEDSDFLRDVVTFHLSNSTQDYLRVHDNQLISTFSGAHIRINSYSLFPYRHHVIKTAQCVPVTEMNLQACNGHINVIKTLMLPPRGNIMDVLSLDKKFSIFVRLVKKSGLADDLQGEGPYTVLAPNNEAFEKAGTETTNFNGMHTDSLQQFVKQHVIKGTLCCAGILRRHSLDQSQIVTMSGDHLKLSRNHDNRPKVGHAIVTICDQTATNGNVHEIDKVLHSDLLPGRLGNKPSLHK